MASAQMDELAAYDYELPAELIATEPLPRRDASRLLVVDRSTGRLEHRIVSELPEILRPGDRLVLNDTRVVPARLFGTRKATGGKWEGLFLEADAAGHWRLIGHSGGKLQAGETLVIVPAHRPESPARLELTLIECDAEGIWTAAPASPTSSATSVDRTAVALLEEFGTVPLPPYLRRKLGAGLDWGRYQTTFAQRPGAVAAPTAGLHFTPELFERCNGRGISRTFVTLHVGIGTFRPISVELLERARHARRVVRAFAASERDAERHARSRWPDRRRRHDERAHAGDGLSRRPVCPLERPDPDLHPAPLSIRRRRLPAHELPPATLDVVRPGERAGRPGADPASLR